ncbi:hypothetical protein BRADI_1g61979v3 [Brachypodium distachyon]|uniref:Uncharacterized protein n=1 Tax=Brachypodium distachyon TaxID=15368 RepID=A0A2K2DSY4_BRADI|nr:hypothetical protein BRADI_1g61979v3 [Brachypodium distachyon]
MAQAKDASSSTKVGTIAVDYMAELRQMLRLESAWMLPPASLHDPASFSAE